jgi:exopolysaccharide biosynthesis predicted pyruvyltransferase EpsI
MSAPTPILEPAAYAHVFDRWRGATIMQFWGPGNVGDLLIRHGAEQLFVAYDIKVTADADSANVVFYGGGGNMGPLYPGTRLTRLEARTVASAHGLPLVVLPQSWTGPEEFEADQFFARENRSLEFCPHAMLAPDLGLAYAPTIQLDEPQHDVGWFMRADCERAQPGVAKNCGDPAILAATAENYVRMASCYRVVHTDRLHFAIAAMIAGREAHLYANSYFKNEAMYHLWLKGRGCQWGGKLAAAN